MKITGFRVENYTMQMDRPIADSNYPAGDDLMPSSLLWIETDEGVSGIAPGGGDVERFFHLLEGQDPREVVGLWRKMVDYVHKGGLVAVGGPISSIDIALWDLKAKLAEEPLWQTFGALEGRTKAYASGIGYCLSDEDLFAFYRRMAERGVDGGKLKIGLDMTADLRRIGIMRDALSVASPRPQLMIDVNEYWSPKQTVRFMHEIEKHYDITWIEEPARRWDYEGLSQVSRQIKAAVATAENLKSIGEVYPLIHNQAVDIINVSTATSGFTGCRQVAHLAYAYELPVSMMNCQANYMAHLAAALPNHLSMEVVDPGREHCLDFDNHIEEGFIVLGDKPGLGIEVNEQKLRALQENPPARKSNFPFARREGAGAYVKGVEEGEVPWK
ncbi:MAG: mandelate racemase/muconate lactonizing enzyme family protein [Gemmatimonadetes bacterium]|jgi:L-alanine-DL-glutamate epimerase-like enolase superfamily enzyme|nr:mandelate racemase/muconate lactonizing enzyme family protein [Gemmatimonadota bacterium]MDE0961642.1 mandelate racemase/muconate lactonizing enzyme family protein [Candidatus Latescibacterota bacterium]MBT5447746.1 mandelate racemase/muconate lactonizing enzyme family protein [Gemmatimonadota bacterium]MBT5803689.1 mandelate racemase/muconate lactonizing enzyme family protein [Gemmatimonadota bacterium]MBT6620759.1 mandelate racemase/muconate lactonizing enzyme family protein [Gemmatimonado|tara:strand:+ start:176 stop:1333 length:1158 start_codon:yes stop_codon:yes gene_type:complete